MAARTFDASCHGTTEAHMISETNRRVIRLAGLLSLLAAAAMGTGRTAAAQGTPPAPWAAVDSALGRPGAMQPGGVVKYGFPRGDLHVVMDGVPVKPALALGGWIAFMDLGRGQSMAMGDLVLAPDEVSAVIRALQQGGVQVTALHNHLIAPVMYMHVEAQGSATKIASAIRAALATTKTPPAAAAPAAADAAAMDTAGIARALGHAGRLNGTVYQVSVPRAAPITAHGHVVPPSMGVATGINFQSTGGGKAAITGDFVLVPSEVNPVMEALESHGIRVQAVHSHMLSESPRLFFMHFWANDDAVTLARGLRTALDRTASR
jgi:hypothetical protein